MVELSDDERRGIVPESLLQCHIEVTHVEELRLVDPTRQVTTQDSVDLLVHLLLDFGVGCQVVQQVTEACRRCIVTLEQVID